jgi:hypothetical protein
MATTHPDLDGELDVGQPAVGHGRALAHPHPVGHLLGPVEIGDQGTGDAQAVGDDAPDVDGGVADALDGAHDLEHRCHGVGVAGRAGGQHAHRSHPVDELGEALLELVDLLGHGRVPEVDGGVGQVDHELGAVLGLREHGLEVAGPVVHASGRA